MHWLISQKLAANHPRHIAATTTTEEFSLLSGAKFSFGRIAGPRRAKAKTTRGPAR
jgi:hypothetical protein